jgi:translocator protein
MKTNKWFALLVSLVVTLGVGFGSGYGTMSSVNTWYTTLHTSVLNPPGWVFGPVWTILYILMAVAVWMVWNKRKAAPFAVKHGIRFYILQLILNAVWSVIFFGLHMPLLAYIDLIVLWVTIVTMMFVFARASRAAAWLIAPYVAWVTFAGYLNLMVVLLNP